MSIQTTLDVGGAVSAADATIQLVRDSLTGSRSVTIEIDNNTTLKLRHLGSHHLHGTFAKVPSFIIEPGKAETFGSQSKGHSVMTGTEGWVKYFCENPNLGLLIARNNPYLGDNNANAKLDGKAASDYKVFYSVGGGDTGALIRFELFPADKWPQMPQIADITDIDS